MGAGGKSYDEIVDSKDGALSDDEQAELDRFSELERLIQLVKARARGLSSAADH